MKELVLIALGVFLVVVVPVMADYYIPFNYQRLVQNAYTINNITNNTYEGSVDTNASTACSANQLLDGGGGCVSNAEYIFRNGSVALTGNWSTTSYSIFAQALSGELNFTDISVCADGQILQMVGSDWRCGDDDTGGASQSWGNITGAGTEGYMAMWTNATDLNESIIFQKAGNVGIGTTGPLAKLEIWGAKSTGPSNTDKGITQVTAGNNNVGLNFGSYTASPHGMWVQSMDNRNGYHNAYPLLLNPIGGNVGIGATNPGNKLEIVGGSVSLDNNQAYRIEDTGGISRAVIRLSYENNNVLLNPNTGAEVLAINNEGNVGINSTSPSYPLEVSAQVSNISIYAQTQVSATGYITRTSVYDKADGSALDKIHDAGYYKDAFGNIDHDKFYGYSGTYPVTDYSRPVFNQTTEEVYNETTEKYENVTVVQTTYPYKKLEQGVSLDKEVDLLRQAVYELKTENQQMQASLCKLGEIKWC